MASALGCLDAPATPRALRRARLSRCYLASSSPNAAVQGPNFLIVGDYKLLLGDVTYAVWTGPQSPNATTDATKQFFLQWNCSECQPPVTLGRINCTSGCLYDVRLFVFLLCCACVC